MQSGCMAPRRLFVAVELPPGVRALVSHAVSRVRPLAPRARWVAPEKLHLTLQFLGAVESERVGPVLAALDEAAARGAGFTLQLAGAGTFGRPARPSVLWLGATEGQQALGLLARWAVERLAPLGLQPDARPYVPHLTLARAAGSHGEPGFAGCVEALSPLELPPFEVGEWSLMETLPDGRYARLRAVRLPSCRFSAHTSEVQLELEAGSLPGLVTAAARGFGELMLGEVPPWEAPGEARAVTVEAADDAALLVGFLNELVYLGETVPGIPFRAEVREVGGGRLRAVVSLLAAQRFKTAVKAATLHGARCAQRGGAWEGRVVLDV